MEKIIFQLITLSGEAKSYSLEAIQLAKKADIIGAKERIELAEDKINSAHRFQTELIQKEAGGEDMKMSLLLVHAQDHLMNSIMLKEICIEFIDLYESINDC
ncbi:PTS lactose/cellobiose transporter subunit IIA [Wukongibacter sp. M2B1]|uniref:PTS lactose/cellobiose transporter subunit IIA n=1 Tax=Wukongibacter sp. M2B1 TaxID=3088895 RepID=UPI003D7B6BE5